MAYGTVVEDIEQLKQYSQLALRDLSEGRFDRLREELERIVSLDITELRKLLSEHGNKRVIQECSEVLKSSRTALSEAYSRKALGRADVEHIQDVLEKIHYLLVEEEDEELKETNETARLLRDRFNFSGGRLSAGREEIMHKLGDAGYRKLYIGIWAEKILRAPTFPVLRAVISIGWDPHQGCGIDPQTHPDYRPVRHALAQKLKQFLPYLPTDYNSIFGVITAVFPPALVQRTIAGETQRKVTTGKWLFKKKTVLTEPHSYKEFIPMDDIIKLLEK